ncbi:putative glycosyltransferase [Pseudochelatococcus lubricantis]|uniref:Glycosyltransferase n=1 Tax=Pseudochelatococcus lubricantis TaxID=1538102 RepID=A0ABX0UYG4_9HYPH|nr:glycosyltransferase [Pseudochelatococcus lubricantis]NIJ56635.1 putative glycosyltransferase [Pseudochelatococcus lubricantis]
MAAVNDMVSGPGRSNGVGAGEAWPLADRVMIYSHDTFGLGHLRRACAIANAIVAHNPAVSVLIVSGSPVIGNYEFDPGVDYVRIPGVVKQPDGGYRSLNLNMSIDEAVALRAAIIARTAESFRPGLFIVDKEPTGFRGEVMPALELLRARGARLVLGIRDILDEPALLVPEWTRKGATEALAACYDEIWIYGLPQIHEPLEALGLSEEVRRRIIYTGYLRREVPRESRLARYPELTHDRFVLVTTGGGGDGEDVIDWVISAYETQDAPDIPALIVFGPFLNRERRDGFMARIARIPQLDALGFDAKLEVLMDRAAGVVAMGGYNTFCELLSFDKRALIVPRTRPRLEQYIRAVQAEKLGLARMLCEDGSGRDPARMASAIRMLQQQPRPSDVVVPGLLDGLEVIKTRLASFLKEAHHLQSVPTQAAE